MPFSASIGHQRLVRPAMRYGVAGVTVLAATLLALAGVDEFAEKPLAFPFYAAVVLSAWVGPGPGIVAVILSVGVVEYFWALPNLSFAVVSADLPWFLSFVVCVLMAFAWGWQRRNAENELEATVQQRTADLQQANEALQAEMIERETAQKERSRTERALREAEAELARTSRLAAMAELAGAIAHEINQPLAAITANGSACLRSLKREPPLLENALEAAECIVADGHRAADVISRIRALFNKEQHQHQTLKVNRVIVQVLELLRPELDRHQVQVKQELIEAEPPVSADPVQLQQVMVNLVTNAIEAMTEIADRPRQLVVRSELDPAGNLVVVVEDSGQGIDPQQVSHVFDSFYTTKPNGIGLGLSISRSVIESHGGSIWAATSRAGGASVGFSLPIASAGEVATRVD